MIDRPLLSWQVEAQTVEMRKPLNNSINFIEYTLHFAMGIFWVSKTWVLQSLPPIRSYLPAASPTLDMEALK